ncbi:hypothetical protein PR202_ga02957 [Eleusine coracana subsp. coracana]|uniref:ARM repeat superfamily protein n=1 Tax=Eleusine coracana subsp. coracana TaxID=191504 RepID=A0AAV5BMV5_ELECO|nr:hypothetical protein PR202_ga02957 [Eleusine coracana subsp. coracana]
MITSAIPPLGSFRCSKGAASATTGPPPSLSGTRGGRGTAQHGGHVYKARASPENAGHFDLCVIIFFLQIDSTYMFNLESQIPRLCHLSQEMGDKEKIHILHAAGLQALSSMIWFMGEHSHISAELDNVVSAVMENYESPYANSDDNDTTVEDRRIRWVSEVLKTEGHEPPAVTILTRVPSWKDIRAAHGELKLTIISREATTVRRVLEAIFRYFDTNNLWSPSKGFALCVLLDIQIVMEKSGQNAHILLSMLVKHLEHKNVLKQPDMILDVTEVTARLAEHSKAQSSTALMAAISDMVRHLGKSMQSLVGDSGSGDNMANWNNRYGKAVDECLVQLSKKVGDAGPILDTLAVVLENISSSTAVARSTISAAYRTAQIVASLPNLSHQSKTTSMSNDAKLFKSQTLQRMASTKDTSFPSSSDTSSSIEPNQEKDTVTLMLSVRQANLLLSSLWTQALSPENIPRNYEAISHTYSLMLLFSGVKGSIMKVLVGSFQLAFSLRGISLQAAFNVPSLIPIVKHVLTESTVDPFLHLVEDCRLQALDRQAEPRSRVYGSKEDDDLALKSLSNISMNEDQSKETSVSLVLNSLENLSELELSTIRKQLLEEFSAEDVCPLGSHFAETPSIYHQYKLGSCTKNHWSLGEPQSQHKLDSSLLDVSQLLESVSDTSRHVGRSSASNNHDLPFKELTNQCEELSLEKQQKLSVCMSGHQKEVSYHELCTL